MSDAPKVGRNDACPCGSGKKYKRCCEAKRRNGRASRTMMILVLAILAGAIAVSIASFGGDTAAPIGQPGRVWSPEHGHYH